MARWSRDPQKHLITCSDGPEAATCSQRERRQPICSRRFRHHGEITDLGRQAIGQGRYVLLPPKPTPHCACLSHGCSCSEPHLHMLAWRDC